MLIDCHVHLDSYPDGEVAQVLERAEKVGVEMVICAGTTVESSRRSVGLSGRFQGFYSGVGIHPMEIERPVDQKVYEQLRRLAESTDKVLVISEIGLDFMEGTPDRPLQYQAFREQIRLARDLGLPIVFHSREADEEVLRLLREERAYEVGGVMHYFQADDATARQAIDLGFFISLARPLLRLPHLQAVAANLPLDSIVLETDAAPQPFKSKRENWTEPRHLREIAEKLAEFHGATLAEVESATTANIRTLLGDRWSVVERSSRRGGELSCNRVKRAGG
jgi:TatD DNase family protein